MSISESVRVPPIKKGWMTKQNRGGLVKNWKKRFFVLMAGKIFYYVNEAKEYPYGEAQKGEMNLVNTELEPQDRLNPCQIFVSSFNGEHNLLMQTATPAEAVEWRASLTEHIRFANSSTEETVSRMSRRITSTSVDINAADGLSPLPALRKTIKIADTEKSKTESKEGEKAAVEAPELSPQEAAMSLLDAFTSFVVDSTKRNEYLASVSPKLQSIFSSFQENLSEGEVGNRGEALLGGAGALVAIILIGFIPRLVFIINIFFRLLATLLIASGISLFSNALWELGGSASPFLLPPKTLPRFVKSGVYGIVRHPMYGGVILLCFGWSMLQQHTYKVFFSIALSIVLSKCAEIEEEALEKAFPKDYPTYASHRKALIPFLY